MYLSKKDQALLVLGFSVAYDPSTEQIKDSFRKAAFDFHPDRDTSPEALGKFLKAKKARDYLLDETIEFDPENSSDEYASKLFEGSEFEDNMAGYKYWWLENFSDFY